MSTTTAASPKVETMSLNQILVILANGLGHQSFFTECYRNVLGDTYLKALEHVAGADPITGGNIEKNHAAVAQKYAPILLEKIPAFKGKGAAVENSFRELEIMLGTVPGAEFNGNLVVENAWLAVQVSRYGKSHPVPCLYDESAAVEVPEGLTTADCTEN